MPSNDLLYMVPGWVIASTLLTVCIVVVELGFRVGRARKRAGIDDDALTTIEGALLGLLALLIAFTYSLASDRNERRRQFVLEEANAIGTAELRARLMPAPHGERLQAILRDYVDVRLEFFYAGIDQVRLERALHETNRLLAEAWSTTKQITDTQAHDEISALLVESVNEVIDLSGKRLSAMRDHVPEMVIFLHMLIAIATVGLVGHCVGSKGARSLWTSITIPAVVVTFLSMTIDLDRPRRGLIKVSQQPMIDLQQSLRPK